MNIKNYVPNDHVMSINETLSFQAQMIQLLTIEINDKDKQINELKEQLEAYENMRKEAIDFVMQPNIEIREYRSCDMDYEIVNCDLLDILNKVGGSDE